MIEDLLIAARTLWGEARGESHEGKKAVAHVLLNRFRAGHGRASTLAGVCLQPLQFSCWNGTDPNLPLLRRVGLEDRTFRECLRAVLEAMDEPDSTKGSRHYLTHEAYTRMQQASTTDRRNWAKGAAPSVIIGNHVFLNHLESP